MTVPKMLSPEEVEAKLRRIALTGVTIPEDVAEIRSHIAALEADNAALLAILRKWLEADGDAEMPDLTEMTEKQRAAFVCYLEAHDIAGRPHPGAALLAEHAKALVRARNAGLEKAAEWLTRVGMVNGDYAACRIRAMKEPET